MAAIRMMLGEELGCLRLHHRGLKKVAVNPDIKELGVGRFVRFASCDLAARDDLTDVAVGIVDIASDDRARRTHDHAGRFQVHFNSMRAEVALRRGVATRIEIERIVGTRLHARFAPDATIVVEIDDTVVAPKQ